MTRDEYRHFIEQLARDYLNARQNISPKLIASASKQLATTDAGQVLNYIRRRTSTTEEVYQTFKKRRIRSAIAQTADLLQTHNELAMQSGVADIADAHLYDVVAGVELGDFPDIDREVLVQMGLAETPQELDGLVLALRSHIRANAWQYRQLKPSAEMEAALEGLRSAERRFDSGDALPAPSEPTTRKWLTGTAKVLEGAALSITDIVVACGFWQIPVSVEARTIGAVISTMTGCARILEGVGNWKGE